MCDMMATLLLMSCWSNEEAMRSMRTSRFSALASRNYPWMILVRLSLVTMMVRLLFGSHWNPAEVANPFLEVLLAVRRTRTPGFRTLISNYSYHDEWWYERSKQRLAKQPASWNMVVRPFFVLFRNIGEVANPGPSEGERRNLKLWSANVTSLAKRWGGHV